MRPRLAAQLALFLAGLAAGPAARGAFDPCGPSLQAGVVHTQVLDLNYIHRAYFFIADHPLRVIWPSLVLYRDDRNPADDLVTGAVPGRARLDPTQPPDSATNPEVYGHFDRLLAGQDYDVIFPYGPTDPEFEIPVVRLHVPLAETDLLGVRYIELTAAGPDTVGRVEQGAIPQLGKLADEILLKAIHLTPDLIERTPDGRYLSSGPFYPLLAYELRNFYDLGLRDIPLDRLCLDVRHSDSNFAVDPDEVGGIPLLQMLGLDQAGEPGSANPASPDGRIDSRFIDAAAGTIFFPDLHPFDPDTVASGGCAPGFAGFLCLDDIARNRLREGALANPYVYYYRSVLPATDTRFYLDAWLRPLPPRPVTIHFNRPNPFNPATAIDFELREASAVRVRLYDARGTLVRTLFEGSLPAGLHETTWSGADARGRPSASGVYFCVVETPSGSDTRTMVLLR